MFILFIDLLVFFAGMAVVVLGTTMLDFSFLSFFNSIPFIGAYISIATGFALANILKIVTSLVGAVFRVLNGDLIGAFACFVFSSVTFALLFLAGAILLYAVTSFSKNTFGNIVATIIGSVVVLVASVLMLFLNNQGSYIANNKSGFVSKLMVNSLPLQAINPSKEF